MASDGEYVDIEHGDLPRPNEYAIQMVAQRFLDVMTKADEVYADLVGTGGYLEQLNNAIEEAPVSTITAPNVDPTMTIPTIPTAPSWVDTTDPYPADPGISTPVFEEIPAIVDPDDPTSSMPATVSPVINYSEITLPTDVYTDLLARILNDLQSGATGLDATVEAAIMERARDRQQVINDRQYDRVVNELDGMNFSMPSGALASALMEQAQDAALFETETSNSIMIQTSDLAQRNSQFSIQIGKDLEALIRQYNIDRNRINLEQAIAAAQLVLQNYAEQVKAYVGELAALRDDLMAQVAKIQAVSAANKNKVDLYLAQWQGYRVQVEAVTAKNQGIVDVFKGEIDAYAAEVGAIGELIRGYAAEVAAKVDAARLDLEAEIATARDTIEGYIAEYQLRVDVTKALANITSQTVAGIWSSINATAGADYNASEGLSESWHHSDSLNEDHSYEHDPPVT